MICRLQGMNPAAVLSAFQHADNGFFSHHGQCLAVNFNLDCEVNYEKHFVADAHVQGSDIATVGYCA